MHRGDNGGSSQAKTGRQIWTAVCCCRGGRSDCTLPTHPLCSPVSPGGCSLRLLSPHWLLLLLCLALQISIAASSPPPLFPFLR